MVQPPDFNVRGNERENGRGLSAVEIIRSRKCMCE